MKWLKWLWSFVIVWWLVSTVSVLAGPNPTVTVTVRPLWTSGLTNFAITYISDTQMDLSWQFAGDGVAIMIRGKYGDYPTDIPDMHTTPSDGYLVYQGSGLLCSDTSMNFDQNPGPLYYKAWAQRIDGTWHTNFDSGWKESEELLMIALMILALVPTVAAFALKSGRAILCFVAAGGWALLGTYNYTKAVTPWDINYSLFWLSMGMCFVCVLLPAILRDKKEEGDFNPLDEFDGEDRDFMEADETNKKDEARLDRLMGGSRRRRRVGMSTFARTGKEKRKSK